MSLNKSEISELIYNKIGGDSVFIGDVLNKPEIAIAWTEEERMHKINNIWCLWYEFGTDKSLQEIIEKSRWEYWNCIDPECKCGEFPLRNDKCDYKTRLKNPNARSLFEFLKEIFK